MRRFRELCSGTTVNLRARRTNERHHGCRYRNEMNDGNSSLLRANRCTSSGSLPIDRSAILSTAASSEVERVFSINGETFVPMRISSGTDLSVSTRLKDREIASYERRARSRITLDNAEFKTRGIAIRPAVIGCNVIMTKYECFVRVASP